MAVGGRSRYSVLRCEIGKWKRAKGSQEHYESLVQNKGLKNKWKLPREEEASAVKYSAVVCVYIRQSVIVYSSIS